MKKIAIVVQRCHESVVGGSESGAWQYANLLKNDYKVDILTTTAIDEHTWANALCEGSEIKNGICIRRFNVTQGRTIYWHKLNERLSKNFNHSGLNESNPSVLKKNTKIWWTTALQEEYIRHQGPYCSGLIKFFAEEGKNYKVILFFTYLYSTTYFGILNVPSENTILIPTLHNEPPAYMPAYKYMARKAKKIMWLTEAEQRNGMSIWGELHGRVVGLGVETKKFNPKKFDFPYLLYCGRINIGKGCKQLIEYFKRYKKDNPSNLHLILIGKSDDMELPVSDDIVYRGHVAEDEKFKLMSGAVCFVMPSRYESLSITTLEAMAQQTPVVVNGLCSVLLDHIKRSGGGILYRDYSSFADAVNEMLKNEQKRVKMGKNGRTYVVSSYGFNKIRQILKEEIEKIVNKE